MTRLWIRLEGLFVLAAAATMYFYNDYSWWLFLLLLLFPDVFMIGYVVNNKVGARIYNVAHTYITPMIFLAAGFMMKVDFLILISFIWIAHIGMDRMFGFGLKYETEFKDTHLQRV
ncbi:DUF4260 domain-containing protein [Paenibacillus silvae]|uniref:DUF4260 domain-containing protein n=1 Tax=Paenibacillus silvae TaxID=1325358 RepID=UPI002003760C|nr:DUF4260 domain-containing protein [Paenibacillus silvae]MCK6073415.1 DUF4260 domain-containing protein [Paenibacillus silvae]MCK6149109.1 DUF4260 domain-containing protein [Paenibacillus silvae]MCK6267408.1 DUF4260 domain-containing protein [Paenibacillus silvae]